MDNDEVGKVEVDKRYGNFAWELFHWLNPKHDEVRWKDWTILEEDSPHDCKPPDKSSLARFEGPPGPADCSSEAEASVAPPTSNPIWDIHGNLVEFEVRVNPVTKDQLCDAGKREEEAYCRGILGNAWSRSDLQMLGPIHIKIAWKKLVKQDCDLGRKFILQRSMQFGCEAGQAGMVAMHATIKGFSGGHYWTWATFSHRDNLDPEYPMFEPCKGEPDCNACPNSGGPTRISRVNPIPEWIKDLNERQEPPYNNYLLLGIQRQTDAWPEAGPRGEIRPGLVANEIIEWDRQQTDCIGCHSKATVLSSTGDDKTAWECCIDRKPCYSTELPQRFVRCNPDVGDSSKPLFVADFFWGLEAWYEKFDRYCH